MAYTDKAQFKVPRHIVQKGGVNYETITTNKTLTYASSTYQLLLNQTSNLHVILTAFEDGTVFWVKSRASSTHNIVVKAPNGSDTVETLTAGQSAFVVCSGTEWLVLIKA